MRRWLSCHPSRCGGCRNRRSRRARRCAGGRMSEVRSVVPGRVGHRRASLLAPIQHNRVADLGIPLRRSLGQYAIRPREGLIEDSRDQLSGSTAWVTMNCKDLFFVPRKALRDNGTYYPLAPPLLFSQKSSLRLLPSTTRKGLGSASSLGHLGVIPGMQTLTILPRRSRRSSSPASKVI